MERRSTRRIVLQAMAGLALGASGALLAACGGSATTGVSSKSSTAAAPISAGGTVSASASSAAPAGKGKTVRVLTADYQTPTTQQWFDQKFNPAFTTRYGAKAEVEYAGWGNPFNSKRDAEFAAGDAPDILGSGAVMVVDYALRGYMRPIDDYLARWPDNSDFYPVTVNATTYQGKRYGVPTRVDARAMIYRADLMQAVGLDPKHLPQTWDDVKSYSVRLTAHSGTAVTHLGYDPSFGNQQFFPYLWQNGGAVISDDGRHALFASEAGFEALQYWADLITYIDPPGTKLPATPAGSSRLEAGIIAATLGGAGVMFKVQQANPSQLTNFAIAPPLKRKKQTTNVFPNWHGVTSHSKDAELAWSWLAMLTSKEYLLDYDQPFGAVPPRVSLRTAGYMADPKLQMATVADVVLHYAQPQPLIAAYAQCWSIMDKAIATVFKKTTTAKDALTSAAQQWDAAIAQSYSNAGK